MITAPIVFLGFGNSGLSILSGFRELGVDNPLCTVGGDKEQSDFLMKLTHPSELDTETTYLITCGLGGNTAMRDLPSWLAYMNEKHIEYRCVLCTPFKFEGEKKLKMAAKAQTVLSAFPNIQYHSLNEKYEEIKDMLISEALIWHAKMILQKFENWQQVVTS